MSIRHLRDHATISGQSNELARCLRYEAQHIASLARFRPEARATAGSEDMTVEQSPRTRTASPRVRLGREALLNASAASLLQPVREIMCEPTRTQIVRALSAGPLSVGDLANILNRSKSATSQHLRVLRDGGVVTARRRGRAVIYSLVQSPMVTATVQVLDRAATMSAA